MYEFQGSFKATLAGEFAPKPDVPMILNISTSKTYLSQLDAEKAEVLKGLKEEQAGLELMLPTLTPKEQNEVLKYEAFSNQLWERVFTEYRNVSFENHKFTSEAEFLIDSVDVLFVYMQIWKKKLAKRIYRSCPELVLMKVELPS